MPARSPGDQELRAVWGSGVADDTRITAPPDVAWEAVQVIRRTAEGARLSRITAGNVS